MTISAEVLGVDHLRTGLRSAADDLGDLDPLTRDLGPLVLGVVDPPRRSGALADTVRADPDSEGVDIIAGSGSVVYAGVIHEGWPAHHIRANPFISRAIEKTEDRIADRGEKHLEDALDRL